MDSLLIDVVHFSRFRNAGAIINEFPFAILFLKSSYKGNHMKLKLHWRSLLLAAFAILVFTAHVSRAQDETPPKRLRSPATVRGLVGGESMDKYVIRARKGRTMTVRISWRKEGDNHADFSVASASAGGGEQLTGQESDDDKSWTGKIPRTGDYLISVTAVPSANYTLRVSVK